MIFIFNFNLPSNLGNPFYINADEGFLHQFELPALAVTGVNNEPDLITVIIQLGIIAFGYFLIVPVSTHV